MRAGSSRDPHSLAHGSSALPRRRPAAPLAPVQEDPDSQTQAAPDRALDHGVLRSVYFDLLGRPPFDAERERWLGRGLRELLDELIGSEPHWNAWTAEQLYYFLLIDNFAPRSERVSNIPSDLSKKKLDVREAVHRICLSSSFELRNPGADTFVTVVLEQLCGIEVQSGEGRRILEIGKKIYDGGEGVFLGVKGVSQSDVVNTAIQSKDFSRRFVDREYRRIVRAEPGKKELSKWWRAFHKSPRKYDEMLREWMLSDAYAERLAERVALPNRVFVRTLFVDLLDRLPGEGEEEPLREALDGLSDSGPLRSIVARLLLDSDLVQLPERSSIPDRPAWITIWFQRLLGRDPTESELKTFSEAFDDPACRPTTVLYALVSHPEYQKY